MTKMQKTLKALIALLVSLLMLVALSVSLFASAAETVTETIVVTQAIEVGTSPQKTSYTYVLTPKQADYPMPEGTVDGKYTLPTINGETTDANAPSFTIEIDKFKQGVYEYILEKKEATPEGDELSPEKHIFGYKVEANEAGEMVVIPYICQSGTPQFSEPDENGYPTKVSLTNLIKGIKKSDGNNGQDGKDGQNGTDGKNGSDGTNGTNGKNGVNGSNGKDGTNGRNGTSYTASAGKTNTGDPYRVGLWIGLIVASAGELIVIAVIRRKKEKDEENS